MTLIEVLAATVLLSLVLVSVVLARARAARQWAGANRVLEASRLADAWLTRQWIDIDNFPRDGQGVLDESMMLNWRTQIIANPAVQSLGGECVRLEVYESRAVGDDDAILAIELVLPGEPIVPDDAAPLPGGTP